MKKLDAADAAWDAYIASSNATRTAFGAYVAILRYTKETNK